MGLRLAAAAALIVSTAGCAYLDHNFRVVEEDRFYRSAQMPRGRFAQVIKHHDIGTVINFRGASDEPWFTDEAEICEAFDVAYVNIPWSKGRLPSPESLAHYLELLETSPTPILVHCQGGTHRTGVATAVYALENGATVDEARDAFTIFFMGAEIGEVLTYYEASDKPFAQWVAEDYPAVYAQWEAAREE